MADSLYLNLWFRDNEIEDMLPNMLAILRQFPFSTKEPGVQHVALHPVSWSEATILERRFEPGVSPEAAILFASEQLHEDYAYTFEAKWDVWTRSEAGEWIQKPSPVRLIIHGSEFDDGVAENDGNIQIDLGLDATVLQENAPLTIEAEDRVRANVQQLVEFNAKIEQKTHPERRLLWSESGENFADLLTARLQRIQ